VESLGPEDTVLLQVETDPAQLQIGAVCRFEGPPLRDRRGALRFDRIRAQVDARLHLSPRFRQRLRRIPFGLGRPVWADDERFDLGHHVRSASLGGAGGDRELDDFVGRLLEEPLDQERPLWEMWVVDGLDDGDVAVVLRVNHVLADGLSLLDAAMLLLDQEPRRRVDRAVPWEPQPPPGGARLLASGAADRLRHGASLVAGTAGWAVDPRRWGDPVKWVRTFTDAVPSTAPTLPMTRPVGRRRSFASTSLPMPALVAAKRAHGVTLNDVVLEVTTGGLRRVLGAEGLARLEGRRPRALVPVGTTGVAAGDVGNRFSMMVTDLPVDLDDPVERLRVLHRSTAHAKSTGQAGLVPPLFSLVDVLPLPAVAAIGSWLLPRQPFVNLAVTNLPGGRTPMYLLGGRLDRLAPFITGIGNVALVVGVLSYVDELGVGVTVDPDVAGDPRRLVEAIHAAGSELIGAGT